MVRDIPETIDEMLDQAESISASEVARAAGVSRQAAHAHLRKLVQSGELIRKGRARATRYRRASHPHAPPGATEAQLTYARQGLQEDQVWQDVRRLLPALGESAEETLAYAVTEIVNNAIDHSAARSVELGVAADQDEIRIEVRDDGIGIFEHVRDRLGLPDHLQALQELHKGKLTTMPERHSGEGIYFVSKAVDMFTLESSGLCWIVDNRLRDMAVLETAPRPGTIAKLVVSRAVTRALQQVFAEYTDGLDFSKSRTVIKLFTIGVRFVSRSEAKRLLHGLEKFREVVLDFRGVRGVGQGFADEVFRVWARAHPETKLTPVNMAETVAFMVGRVGS